MNKNIDSLIFNILLILCVLVFSFFIYNIIKEPQIVFVNRPFPENKLLLPRESVLMLPFVFLFIVVYNIVLFKITKIGDRYLDKINFFFFLLVLISEIFILVINY